MSNSKFFILCEPIQGKVQSVAKITEAKDGLYRIEQILIPKLEIQNYNPNAEARAKAEERMKLDENIINNLEI